MKTKLKVYCASGWFTPNQINTLAEMEKVLDEFKELSVFYPKKESKITSSNPTQEEKDLTFKQNVDNIKFSNFIVCSTEDKDIGSVMEAGMAYASSVPIVYVNFTLQGKSFNLMLENSCIAVAKNEDQLREILKIIIKKGTNSKDLSKFKHKGETE